MTFLRSRSLTSLAVLTMTTMVATPLFAQSVDSQGGYPEDARQSYPNDAPPAYPNAPESHSLSYPGAPVPGEVAPDGRDDRPEYPGDAGRAGEASSPQEPYQQAGPGQDPRELDRGPQYDRVEDDRDGDYRSGGSFDEAVDTCADALSRSNRAIGTVDSVRRRDGYFWVDGALKAGQSYACTIDGDGRVRTLTVDRRPVL